ncbi:leucine-rich repeat domain-containing protein [Clostridium tagluense]|uniref:leucine-rich repeat domain-containing protein n=1 Tax=Clostridium tagluense TaxID=360422 RepID=UPI001CF148D1|nr:hypothetical protein [Clostridium tagluense]MCB2300567.1 hypothetical protein [Clostridium tagluense]
MNKKITSSVLVALMIAGSTSFSAFAAMPTGVVVIGTKAFDLIYANNSANISDITASIAAGGSVYVKNFEGNWIDNTTGNIVQASVIPTVVYKNAAGVITNFDAADTDAINANIDITSKFTDKIFRNKVYSLIGKTTSSPILYSDVKNITKLDVSNVLMSDLNSNISNLSGIEYFTALTTLYCGNNKLTSLDVSKNTALTKLRCDINNLSTLDVSKNIALSDLICGNNNLTALDVSKNTALHTLSCENNDLTTLDVSKNTALHTLSCGNNKLTTLDVSKNTILAQLVCNMNNLTILDVSKNTALKDFSCANNELTTLCSAKDTWNPIFYRPQYTNSTHTTTTAGLTVKIKN